MSESESAKTPEAAGEEVNQAIKLLGDEVVAEATKVAGVEEEEEEEEKVTAKSEERDKSTEATLKSHAKVATNEKNDEANKNEMKSKSKKPNETETTDENGTSNADDVDEENENDFDAYAEHVTYESDGSAIYTDPSTKHKYKWCTEQNNWLPLDGDVVAVDENEHYKWCAKTQQWLPKQPQQQQQQSQQQQVTETEHYKWDAEKHEWVAKAHINNNSKTNSTTTGTQTTTTTAAATATAAVSYGVDEQGERIYTDRDGVVFVWDADKCAWFPKIDDDFMARYQMNYGFIDNTSAGEQEKREREQQEVKRKEEELKRMADEARAAMAECDGSAVGHKRKAQEPAKWFDPDPAQNTKVYVSNLPLDITIDEFAELMGKCGMIMRDQQTQKYKLKLYAEEDGQIKGDGLCDYIKVESVDLALKILDDYDLRGHKIHVQRAQFQMRGEYNPSLKPKRKKKDKEKLQKMKEKLFDWRPDKMRGERSKNEKTVIIKNLFTPELFEKEVQLILDYQNDLRDECGKCGTVRKVVIYDRHPEGIAQVNMASPEEADLVIQMMQGRYFGQRQLSAACWDGKTKYKIDESASEAQKRLTKWDQFLETDEALESKVAAKSTEDKLPADV